MHIKIIRSLKKDLKYDDAKKEMFSDKDFLDELQSIANSKKLDIANASLICNKYLKKIAAKYLDNKIFWSIVEFVVRKKIIGSFENIYFNKDNIGIINKLAKENIIAVLPNHRSVFDFVILPYILVKETSFMPIISAADIFDKFLIGNLFRRMGAYYVRRNESDKLYFLVFKYYVMLIVKYELLHMFFIEGGRNKSGSYSEPKTGILRHILNGKKKHNIQKDFLFIPVNISYDCVPESEVVIEENLSGQRKSIFKSVIKYLTKNELGNCYINFGEPIRLSNFLAQYSEHDTISSLANSIMQNIKSLVTVSPTSLLCYTILKEDKISLKEFEEAFKINLEKLRAKNKNLRYIDLNQIANYISFAHEKGIITYNKQKSLILVDSKKKPIVEYYSNNIRHLFE